MRSRTSNPSYFSRACSLVSVRRQPMNHLLCQPN